MTVDLSTLIPVFATALFGAIGFLIRSYLHGLDRRIEQLQAMTHNRNGQFDTLLRELRQNNQELVKVRYELQAVWRFIDNAPKRATDIGVRNG